MVAAVVELTAAAAATAEATAVAVVEAAPAAAVVARCPVDTAVAAGWRVGRGTRPGSRRIWDIARRS